jgi:hypothetical protein
MLILSFLAGLIVGAVAVTIIVIVLTLGGWA